MKLPAPARPRFHSRAFTLVELLVVIGIIALLISILLPALSAARRQAASAKCAAQLREIGNAFQMYAVDSKGWYPPAQLVPASGNTYDIGGVAYPSSVSGRTYNAMWFNFLSKYVTKYKAGGAVANDAEANLQRSTIIWGCPAWEGYWLSNSPGGFSVVQTGFGMNAWPTHTTTYPALTNPPPNHPPAKECVFIASWTPKGTPTSNQGEFVKQVVWGKNGAERCLIADCLFWQASAERVLPAQGMIGQGLSTNTAAVSTYCFSDGNTTIDCYRHGKYPGASGDGLSLKTTGGKLSFNVLFADGHVANLVDRSQAFRSIRQRYPN